MAQATMTIGQVAAQAGVRTSTIRYYEGIGVLPVAEREAGQRRYGVDVLRRLAIVDVAQRAGFSLEDVRELLGATDAGASERLRKLAESKVPAVDALIERAQGVKRWLEAASACECATLDVCALFDDRALGLPKRVHGDALNVTRLAGAPSHG
jgi:MerR family transcriptional regulator, redox-sensitive transcriptional activator SoxR